MKILKPENKLKIAFRFLLALTFLVGNGLSVNAGSEDITYRINNDIKIKRVSGGTVCLYTYTDSGKKEEFVFNDFNADVILLLYRRIDMTMIIKNLSRKYFLSKTDTRRIVKMTINTLEQWDLVTRY